METNKEIKFKDKVIDFVKRHKLITFLAVLSVLSIIFIIASINSNQKGINLDKTTTTPTTKPTETINSPEYKRSDPNNVYLINRFETVSEIFEPSWYQNKIVYATKFGIHNLWQNKIIVRTQMSEADFSGNGTLVYVQGGNLYYSDISTSTNESVDTQSSRARINDSGKFAAYDKNGNLTIINLETKDIKNSNIGVSDSKDFDWVINSELLYVYNRSTPLVEIYDTNLQKKVEYKIGKEEFFYGLGANLKYLATTLGDTLQIKNTSSGDSTEFKFTKSSELHAYWISDSQMFIIEKTPRGVLDLYDQYFWMINVDNRSRTYLTNSLVITNKINENIKPKINKDKTAITLTENKGNLWVISLVPSYLSVYKEEGLSFYKVETNTQEY